MRLPLRFEKCCVVLDEVGPLFVDAAQTHRVVPEVVQQERNRPAVADRHEGGWRDLQRCPPTTIDDLDPAAGDVDIVTERIDDAGLNCVMSNSFGFGGTNASLVFKRYED